MFKDELLDFYFIFYNLFVRSEERPEINLSRNYVKEEIYNRNKDVMKFSPTTAMAGDAPSNIKPSETNIKKKQKKRKFAWRIMGFSPCSKTCGGGKKALSK